LHRIANEPVLEVRCLPTGGVSAALGASGCRYGRRLPELEQLTLRLLGQVGVRVLVIDDCNTLRPAPPRVPQPAAVLGNELKIPLVGVGTQEAYLAIRSDDQLENRFKPFVLPRWQADEQACQLLASFATSFPLRRPSPIATMEMAEYLLTRSEGTIGELAALLTEAAAAAIESGQETINQRTLLMADYAGPTERRLLFERELA
jgi:hypothetical protein